ncbi:MAG TPA: hypothetical protein VFK20_08955 [Vicinamibacterales bacterium]|nr:hypothetical protein [Vicinamibacterales bacterium]
MSLVLAIEPDLRQAAILQRVIQEKVRAELVVVDSRDAAIAAVNAQIPDVLLLSALLSPRDEDELISHLRDLGPDAEHLQTHTIPQLASSEGKSSRGKGLFSTFRKKKEVEQTAGCDPDLFADEIRSFLKRAAEMKAEAVAALQSRVHELEYRVRSQTPAPSSAAGSAPRANASAPAEPAAQEAAATPGGSAWDSPFEWRRATPPTRTGQEEPAAPPAPVEEPPVPASVLLPEPAADVTPSPMEAVPLDAAPLETSPLDEAPLVEPVRYLDDSPEPVAQEEPEEIAAAAPELEEAVHAVAPAEDVASIVLPEPEPIVLPEPEPIVLLEPEPAIGVENEEPEIAIVLDEPVAEPVIEAPAPKRRRKGSSKRGAGGTVRLTPLAMWARSEARIASPPPAAEASADRTTADEVRDLMAGLSIPPHVAAVSYARGCRIRRVRVPAASRTEGGHVPGPVILSKRALSERRANSAR